MKCVRCGEKTEVLETIPGATYRRRRRCLNPACQYRFTTVEADRAGLARATEEQQVKALKRAFPGRDIEAINAALAVDRRKEQIKREQKRRDEVFEDEDPIDVRRELRGY